METFKVGADDFLEMFDCGPGGLPPDFFAALARMDTRHRDANNKELEEYVLALLKKINSPEIFRAKEENHDAWEKGWKENLDALSPGNKTADALKPRYYRGSKFLRYKNKLIVTDNINLEHDLFVLMRIILFRKYLLKFDDVYEFGCGSCQNLLMLSEMFPEKSLHGFDWARPSMGIIETLAGKFGKKVDGRFLDMLNPDPSTTLKPGAAIITIHALEQIGKDHGKLISFLLNSKPGIVVHCEPILEFYDPNNLLDYLAITYTEKRNYLSGFLTALLELEKQGRIEILEKRRPYLGGVVHEASLIVWRPV